MHRQIGELLTEDQLHELMDQFATRSPALRQELFRQQTGAKAVAGTGIGRLFAQRGRRALLAASLMAAALVVFALSSFFWNGRPSRIDLAEQGASERQQNTSQKPKTRLATLTLLNNAIWVKGAPQFHHGEQLMQGARIALVSGLAKVTFDCGAEVVLEGPCEFEAREPMVGFLKSGRITADVPRRAFAFAILSPKVDFVDLGTSFGLSVGDEGNTELHVFRGEVLCSRSDQDDKQRGTVYHVMANKAVEFGAANDAPSDIAMNEKQFVEHFELRRGVAAQGSRLPEGSLALWLSADMGVTVDSSQRVISWRDILYGENQSGEDAIQVDESARPRLVRDAPAGRAAIRFDGTSDYLLTTPLATTDDQTVALVCQFSPSALDKSRRWGGQILNYDGPPSRYLSDTLEPGVLQIGEPLLEQEFKPTLLSAQVFAGFIGSATVESGRVDATPVGVDTPIVLTYRYNLGEGRASLALNGKTFTEIRAFAPQAITSRKIIGRHAWMQNFFHGDLSEIMIYNKALSVDELNRVTKYLAGKYSIKLGNDNKPAR
jgi:hypothetical protein